MGGRVAEMGERPAVLECSRIIPEQESRGWGRRLCTPGRGSCTSRGGGRGGCWEGRWEDRHTLSCQVQDKEGPSCPHAGRDAGAGVSDSYTLPSILRP